MAYTIDFRPAARRAFANLPPQLQARLQPAVDALAALPRPPGCKKLRGERNLWRIRVGDYRIVYEIHDQILVVLVIAISHRREAYR